MKKKKMKIQNEVDIVCKKRKQQQSKLKTFQPFFCSNFNETQFLATFFAKNKNESSICEYNLYKKMTKSIFNPQSFHLLSDFLTSVWIKSQLTKKKVTKGQILISCLLVIQFFSMCQCISSSSIHLDRSIDNSISDSYTTYNSSINFTHVAYDALNDRLYLGASNWLYQLNSALDVEIAVQTGPIEDSPFCSPSNCTKEEAKSAQLTTNVNKLLVIDHRYRKLIVCGSVHQGACRRHSLKNISNQEELIPVPVAANDENSSTFAFIGPARYNEHNVSFVLYTGATNSRLGTYREWVPAISSRSLEPDRRLFQIIDKSFDAARVDIISHLRDYFLVTYVYGFYTQDFIYFSMVQKKFYLRALEEWGYVSRLARICSSDAAYNSYTEVTLQCIGPDGTDYTLLQDATVVEAGPDLARDLNIKIGDKLYLGVFSTSKDHTSRPSSRSALCVYSLKSIEKRFNENIHLCYNGSVLTRNMDYIAGNIQNCPELGKSGNVVNFCSETLKLNGSLPITSVAAITFNNQTLTAIKSIVTGRHNVAFVGTSKGHLKKILLSKAHFGEQFEEVAVDVGHKILPDLFVDKSQKYVYATSPYKISKVAIEKCDDYNNCRDCLQARNPYCGWCSLEKRCTAKSACYNSTGLNAFDKTSSNSLWLSLDAQQCIDFQSIKPESLPITSPGKIELFINKLPKLSSSFHYLCVFGESKPIEAEITKNGLLCNTPHIFSRPVIPHKKDHVVVDLSVRSTETQTDFLHRPYIFYDCNAHRTCMDCIKSRWNCDWCFDDNTCTSNISSCSHSSIRKIAASHSLYTSSYNVNRWQYCPSFNFTEEILLPDGVEKEIVLTVKNLPNQNNNFECMIEIEEKVHKIPVKVRGNQVICQKYVYSYKSQVSSVNALLTVVLNDNTFIDKTNVTLYKCQLLGSHDGRADCSLCLTQNSKFNCSWCENSCQYSNTCSETPSKLCPAPRIDWVHPLNGPIEGGTQVVIEGSNLGTSLEEVSNRITIGGVPCRPIKHNVSIRVVCITGPVSKPTSADILVGNRAGLTKARESFKYQIVQLLDSSPKFGPRSGGTRLYLSGINLNIGSILSVYLDHLLCAVDRTLASSTQISCRTSNSEKPFYRVKKLILSIDNSKVTLDNPFEYTNDPTILSIKPLKSFMSGGRKMNVIGSNLASIQQPKLVVFDADGMALNETICEVKTSTHMICPSPPINSNLIFFTQSDQLASSLSSSLISSLPSSTNRELSFRIGFIMDEVSSVRVLSEGFPSIHSDLVYVPDPKFFSFSGNGIKLFKGEPLVIEGENLKLSTTESEIIVTIGTQICNLTSLAVIQLVCIPPDNPPLSTDELGRMTSNNLPMVVIRIGQNLRYEIGYLKYEMMNAYELPPALISGLAVCGLLVMLFILTAVALMKHKSSQAEREYKRIQLQMDTLENSVRSECKQAFAELQTDMTDLTNDLETTGFPALNHRTYVMKVFFPGVYNHPLFQESKLRINGVFTNYELAMGQFEHLLNNKPFLITFINTLENQRTFSIRDRVNVASLLTIIFMERMDYATDILRTLLYQLIDKSVHSKHPQLMLRRTESVVEKMLTNWLALNMYDYLKENVGSSLFLLFSALKHQVEKGPIDSITHDARYSLSEDRLLRDQTCYSPVLIQIFQEEQNQDEKIICKVNDCDTISQVKAKILDMVYKNTFFSLRPCIHDVDLEWRTVKGAVIILADEDLTTKTINGWRRINTLRHYGIKDIAVINLVMKQHDSFNSNCTNNSMSSIMDHHSELEKRIRYWHLIRPNDGSFSGREVPKPIPEIFLTRLLSTKGTVQKFVDDFLFTILSVNENLPPAVKWLFDLFDEAAMRHGILDTEVVTAWKSNSLPLRFWVNFIKNPDFLLDIQKTPVLDSCLSVIAQTLMDACSTSDHRLGKDSPSNKLLFAKDIQNYKKWVTRFYQDVAITMPITDKRMAETMQCLSLAHAGEFDVISALKELYVYAVKYWIPLMESLSFDPICQNLNLGIKLEQIAYTIKGNNTTIR